MPDTRIISRKQMSGEDKYSYCPFCIDKHPGDYEKTLQPLFVVTTATPLGTGKDYIEKHYECTNCQRRNITVDDFVRKYCR